MAVRSNSRHLYGQRLSFLWHCYTLCTRLEVGAVSHQSLSFWLSAYWIEIRILVHMKCFAAQTLEWETTSNSIHEIIFKIQAISLLSVWVLSSEEELIRARLMIFVAVNCELKIKPILIIISETTLVFGMFGPNNQLRRSGTGSALETQAHHRLSGPLVQRWQTIFQVY